MWEADRAHCAAWRRLYYLTVCLCHLISCPLPALLHIHASNHPPPPCCTSNQPTHRPCADWDGAAPARTGPPPDPELIEAAKPRDARDWRRIMSEDGVSTVGSTRPPGPAGGSGHKRQRCVHNRRACATVRDVWGKSVGEIWGCVWMVRRHGLLQCPFKILLPSFSRPPPSCPTKP